MWDKYSKNSKGWDKDNLAKLHSKIYLGSCLDVTEYNFERYNISHVINCAHEYHSPVWFKDQYSERYACIDAEDTKDVNITDWFPLFKFNMDRFLADKECTGIYVHCQAGINRSAFLILTYMCLKFGFTLPAMVKAITIQRPCALQNLAFRNQVTEYIKKHS